MDWMNRGNRPQAAHQPVSSGTNSTNLPAAPHNNKNDSDQAAVWKWLRWASVALLFSGTILVVALLISIATNGANAEAKNVDKSKLQAVFLNGGQVYFGRIKNLNSDHMKVSDIYYLRVNQQVQPNQQTTQAANNDISLVKLGCELHGPQDSMVINREQVIFWENLKDDGQVAKAVAEYVKQNPNGQKCDTPAQTGTGTGTGTQQNTSTTNPTTTNTNTSTTKKP
ncbi:MAG: hypothetical protein JWL85_568 [Candidatus Saccharibacteria bacterium]|nr:hypothetical protein [Candidatus Saccharibacteria bacterium]